MAETTVQVLPSSVPGVRRVVVRDEDGALAEVVEGALARAASVPQGGVFAPWTIDGERVVLGAPLSRTLASLRPSGLVILALVHRVLEDLDTLHAAGGTHGALHPDGWGVDAAGCFRVRPVLHVPPVAGAGWLGDVGAVGATLRGLLDLAEAEAAGAARVGLWARGVGMTGERVSFGEARAARQALGAVLHGTGAEASLTEWLQRETVRLPARARAYAVTRPEPVTPRGDVEGDARAWVEREIARTRTERYIRLKQDVEVRIAAARSQAEAERAARAEAIEVARAEQDEADRVLRRARAERDAAARARTASIMQPAATPADVRDTSPDVAATLDAWFAADESSPASPRPEGVADAGAPAEVASPVSQVDVPQGDGSPAAPPEPAVEASRAASPRPEGAADAGVPAEVASPVSHVDVSQDDGSPAAPPEPAVEASRVASPRPEGVEDAAVPAEVASPVSQADVSQDDVSKDDSSPAAPPEPAVEASRAADASLPESSAPETVTDADVPAGPAPLVSQDDVSPEPAAEASLPVSPAPVVPVAVGERGETPVLASPDPHVAVLRVVVRAPAGETLQVPDGSEEPVARALPPLAASLRVDRVPVLTVAPPPVAPSVTVPPVAPPVTVPPVAPPSEVAVAPVALPAEAGTRATWEGLPAVTGDPSRSLEKGAGKWTDAPPSAPRPPVDLDAPVVLDAGSPGAPSWAGLGGVTGSSARMYEKGAGKWGDAEATARPEIRALVRDMGASPPPEAPERGLMDAPAGASVPAGVFVAAGAVVLAAVGWYLLALG